MFRRVWSAYGCAIVLLGLLPAAGLAQLAPATGAATTTLVSEPSAWVAQNYDIAFDTTNDVYLVVYHDYNGALKGLWLTTSGAPTGSAFTIGPGESPRVLYEASNNTFLITYTDGAARKGIFGRYQSGAFSLLTATPLVIGSLSWTIDTYAGMTYVPSTDSYLVTWWTATTVPGQSFVRSVRLDGSMGAIVPLTETGQSHEIPDISCSSTECLAVGKFYNDAARQRGVWGRWLDLTGAPTSSVFYLDVKSNSHDDPLVRFSPDQNTYLVTWTRDFGYVEGIRLAAGATSGSAVFATAAKLGGQTNIDYNAGTRTFVQVMGGWDLDVFVQELEATGLPRGSHVTVSNGATRDSRTAIAANPELGQFMAIYRHDVTSIRGLLLQGTMDGVPPPTPPPPTPGTFGPASGATTQALVSEPSAWVAQNYDVAYDSVNDVYLLVYHDFFGALKGQWLTAAGLPSGSAFAIGPGESPRVLYEASTNAFLITYTAASARQAIFARRENGAFHVLSAAPIVLGALSWTIDTFAGMTYVPSTDTYLVTWWTATNVPGQSFVRSLKLDGTLGAINTLTPAGQSHELPDVSCAPTTCLAVGKFYNDATKQRGLWARWLNLDGTSAGSLFYLDLKSNTHDDPIVRYSPTQQTFLVTWTRDFGYVEGMRLAAGATTGSAVFSTSAKLGGQTSSAYNTGTRTFVHAMGGWENDVFAQQLDATGAPSGSPVTVSNGSTRDSRTAIAANAELGQFLAVYRHDVTGLRGLLLQGTLAQSTFALTVSKAGTGTGTVTSTPVGIVCGEDCAEDYADGTVVALKVEPTLGSMFTGWTGDADCSDGSVTMSAAHTCTANFSLASASWYALAILKGGSGTGTIVSNPPGILCGASCWENFPGGSVVQLTVTPATGSTFAGWSGDADCADGSVTVSAARTCRATFTLSRTPVEAAPPFGQVDTPIQDATGVVGAIAVTGWALDDVGVSTVKLYRECLPFDAPDSCVTLGGYSVVFIGDADVVPGARPDVEAAYSQYPNSTTAGWGYMLLTNMLPHVPNQQPQGGQGTIRLFAFAFDTASKMTLLGRAVSSDHTPTTVTIANDTIAKPFGAIDTPGQGQVVSGTVANFGWALTPDADVAQGAGDILVPLDGSTVRVFIDGVDQGPVAYNQCRGTAAGSVPSGQYCDDDVANIFGNVAPQAPFTLRTSNATRFRNLDDARGAIGGYIFDTRQMTDGMHSIIWGVTDSSGRADGIGSRYFMVQNSADGRPTMAARTGTTRTDRPDSDPVVPAGDAATLEAYSESSASVTGRTGFDISAPYRDVPADNGGVRHVRLTDVDRLELNLGPTAAGYLVANGTLRPLPAGSSLDRKAGRFTWVPIAGYMGTYRLAFLSDNTKVTVDVTIEPKAGRHEPAPEVRLNLDAPVAGSVNGRQFLVGGWALDPRAGIGSGIDAVHVWARRIDTPGAHQFLGAATLGVSRPDVAAAFGAQFHTAGFDAIVEISDPGVYEITAYVWCARTNRWEDARSATVTIADTAGR